MTREIDNIHDQNGKASLRLFDDGGFVDFEGHNQGFVYNHSVYTYLGKHVGWFEGGLLKDLDGMVVGFGEKPSASPITLPMKQMKPMGTLRELPPIRPVMNTSWAQSASQAGWSKTNPVSLLQDN